MSRKDVQLFTPPEDTVVISINETEDRGIPLAALRPGYKDVLVLRFDDADPDNEYLNPWGDEDFQFVYMDEEQARRVVEFAREHQDSRYMVIHCFAGISRSTATALAVAEILGASDSEITFAEKCYPNYNRYVRQKILEAA